MCPRPLRAGRCASRDVWRRMCRRRWGHGPRARWARGGSAVRASTFDGSSLSSRTAPMAYLRMVVEAEGRVAAPLDFGDHQPRTDGVDGAGRHEDHVVGMHLDRQRLAGEEQLERKCGRWGVRIRAFEPDFADGGAVGRHGAPRRRIPASPPQGSATAWGEPVRWSWEVSRSRPPRSRRRHVGETDRRTRRRSLVGGQFRH